MVVVVLCSVEIVLERFVLVGGVLGVVVFLFSLMIGVRLV